MKKQNTKRSIGDIIFNIVIMLLFIWLFVSYAEVLSQNCNFVTNYSAWNIFIVFSRLLN